MRGDDSGQLVKNARAVEGDNDKSVLIAVYERSTGHLVLLKDLLPETLGFQNQLNGFADRA